MKKFALLLLSLFFIESLAQAPNISYTSPNIFEVGQVISSLLPTNTGGIIPTEPVVSTFAGSGTIGSTDENGGLSQFNLPTVVVKDNDGNLIVVDRSNHKIRKIDTSGNVTTLAGTGSIGSADGTAFSASFKYPDGAIVDSNGNVFITDQSNHKIRKIDTLGNVTTFAGTGVAGYLDGDGNVAKFYYPAAMAIDVFNNLYVADYSNHCIRKITPSGLVSTYAGIGGSMGNIDGNISVAKFKNPTGLCVDNNGNVYLADFGNHKIRKIDTSGNVTTFVGTGVAGNTDGNSTTATFNGPAIVDFDGINSFYVTDQINNEVRKIDGSGNVTTYAGTGTQGATDGIASVATFKSLTGIVVKNENELFIADYGNHKIRKITKYVYTISPGLPDGLVFNSLTGEISGAPTTTSPMTDYTITISNENGISSFVISIEVTETMNTNSFNRESIKVFPVLVENSFKLETGNEIPNTIKLINQNGQILKTIQPKNSKLEVNIEEFLSGIYFVQIETVNKTETVKIIKK